MRDEHTSPYLNDPNRLSDVLAAIQATATNKYYKLDLEGWSDRINGDEKHADHWRRVFEEHPEFFDSIPNVNEFPSSGAGSIKSGTTSTSNV